MMDFKLIDPTEISDNPFKLIGKEWMLITAGNMDSFNTMTAAWGGFGFLWKKNVVFTFIRPQRYTYEFTEIHDFFTLSFFEPKFHDTLMLCGTKSGREIDKMKGIGLTPFLTEKKSIAFNEARLIIECKKIYKEDIIPENFIDPSIQNNYPQKDYHRMYIGEVYNCLIKGS